MNIMVLFQDGCTHMDDTSSFEEGIINSIVHNWFNSHNREGLDQPI